MKFNPQGSCTCSPTHTPVPHCPHGTSPCRPCCYPASVGEVRSGLVPGHFCQTGDQTVQSLTKFLGLGPGLPWTVYIGLVPVQTGSRQSLHYLFIYLFKIEDGGLVWDGTASSSRRRAHCTAQDAQRRSNEGCSSPRGERCVDVDEWWGSSAEKTWQDGFLGCAGLHRGCSTCWNASE